MRVVVLGLGLAAALVAAAPRVRPPEHRAVRSVGIALRGQAGTVATGVPISHDLVLTVRHAIEVHRGRHLRHLPSALEVVVDAGQGTRRLPVEAFVVVSGRVDLAVLRVGVGTGGARHLGPAARLATRSPRRGAVLTAVHRPGGGSERVVDVEVLLPFEATPEEVEALAAAERSAGVRRALRASYRRDGEGLRQLSTRWGGQPVLGVRVFSVEGSSGAPVFDGDGRLAGILFAGDPSSSARAVGWLRHDAVLPAPAIYAALSAGGVLR